MSVHNLVIISISLVLLASPTAVFAIDYKSLDDAQSNYTDVYIDSLLIREKKQDDKEAILSRLIQSTQNSEALANLHCRRAKLRITHTHLPKGIKDLEICIDTLSATPVKHKQQIEEAKQSLFHAKRKFKFTQALASNNEKPLSTRFTALWKLGEREQAVKIIKEKATPEQFSSMSTTRLVKAGYLCEGTNPNDPQKSFKTKKGGPFWSCDEI